MQAQIKKESEKTGVCTGHVQTLSLSIFFDSLIHNKF